MTASIKNTVNILQKSKLSRSKRGSIYCKTADKRKMKEKILVVDDEKGIQDLFRFVLEAEGYEVFTADNGLEGLEMAKKHDFTVIFLDVHMPVMKGPEALRSIKKIKPKQNVVICSSSSDPTFSFEKEAKNLGAYVCLYKPVEMDEIIHLIKEVTKGKE